LRTIMSGERSDHVEVVLTTPLTPTSAHILVIACAASKPLE